MGLLSFGARTLNLQMPENQTQVDQRDLETLKTGSPEGEDGSSYSASSKTCVFAEQLPHETLILICANVSEECYFNIHSFTLAALI